MKIEPNIGKPMRFASVAAGLGPGRSGQFSRKMRGSPAQQVATLASVLVPLTGVIAAIYCMWGWGITWVELATLLGMYTATGLGITVGFHRLFTHRSFETVRPVKFVLGILGSMSVQGPLLKWAAIHRRHHQHSDRAEDPHSPHRFGGGIRGVFAGFWHAHLGWMFTATPSNLDRYVRDLHSDGLLRIVNHLFGAWVVLGLLIPAAVGGLLTESWTGVFLGFLWGGLVRIFLVQHATFSINSICHMWGRQPFECRDESRNNLFCSVLSFGDGWHNNHHAFPSSARHGLRRWEFDLSYLVIRAMEVLGLAWRIQLPAPATIAAKRCNQHRSRTDLSEPMARTGILDPNRLESVLEQTRWGVGTNMRRR